VNGDGAIGGLGNSDGDPTNGQAHSADGRGAALSSATSVRRSTRTFSKRGAPVGGSPSGDVPCQRGISGAASNRVTRGCAPLSDSAQLSHSCSPLPQVTPSTGLSCRRSRTQVPSLPFLKQPANWDLLLPVSMRLATRTTHIPHRNAGLQRAGSRCQSVAAALAGQPSLIEGVGHMPWFDDPPRVPPRSTVSWPEMRVDLLPDS
jgi:hypothetical protein